jgi:hypothetical protein
LAVLVERRVGKPGLLAVGHGRSITDASTPKLQGSGI